MSLANSESTDEPSHRSLVIVFKSAWVYGRYTPGGWGGGIHYINFILFRAVKINLICRYIAIRV